MGVASASLAEFIAPKSAVIATSAHTDLSVPVPKLGIEFIDLDTNFDWRCDIYKYVDCGDSLANAIPGSLFSSRAARRTISSVSAISSESVRIRFQSLRRAVFVWSSLKAAARESTRQVIM